ncbi:MAG: hypothetical protein L6V35_07935 [Alistipes putredinis]|nr:MAG: hypothetical protein L6V35_07935 [Alistipes putredinis]
MKESTTPNCKLSRTLHTKNLAKLVIDYADAIVIEGKNVDAGILEYLEKERQADTKSTVRQV